MVRLAAAAPRLRLLALLPWGLAQPVGGEDDAVALVQRSTEAQIQAMPHAAFGGLGPHGEKPWFMQQHLLRGAPGLSSRAKASTELPAAAQERADEAASRCSADEREQVVLSLRAVAEGKSIAESVCHTAVEGEACYRDTVWAMTDGFKPQLYTGLKRTSSFEEFQMYLFKIGHASCSKPCVEGSSAAAAVGQAHLRAGVPSAEVVFAHMPRPCTLNMTFNYALNFEQMESCFQNLLRLSQPCSSCASDLLRAFVGEDIFHMSGVCLPRCRPMATACQFGSDFGASVEALSGDCLEKAAVCMECVRPSVHKFLSCAGFPNKEQLEQATTVLIEDFRSHSIVYPGKLDAVIRLAQKTGF